MFDPCLPELRPLPPDAGPFLEQLYASHREAELSQVQWADDQKRTFLRQQFQMRESAYRTQFPGAAFDLIVLDGRWVGRLSVWEGPQELRLLEIALLPSAQRRGTGTQLMAQLMRRAAAQHKPMTLHVQVSNPALVWYQRLGFVRQTEDGVYWSMHWGTGVRSPLT